ILTLFEMTPTGQAVYIELRLPNIPSSTSVNQGPLQPQLVVTLLTPEDRQLLSQPEVGGMILFARNTESPAQVRELVRSIRAVRPDMLIAIDQEGGRVQRLRRDVLRLPALGRIAGCAAAEQEQLA